MRRTVTENVHVLSRKNRVLGTQVDLEFWPSEDKTCQWQTICSHSNCVGHDTRAMAVWHMACPWGWCEECQAAFEAKTGVKPS